MTNSDAEAIGTCLGILIVMILKAAFWIIVLLACLKFLGWI